VSKVVNLEVIDIVDGVAVLETESGFEVEMDFDSLPHNIKVGQVVKCAMTLHTTAYNKELCAPAERESRKSLPNGRMLMD
jgi:hypothetical protein